MAPSNELMQWLKNFSLQIPYLLVLLCGIVVATRRLDRFPTASKLALGGLSLLLSVSLIGSGWILWVNQLQRMGWGWPQIESLMLAYGLVTSLLRATALGLLIAAVFVRRGESEFLDEYDLGSGRETN